MFDIHYYKNPLVFSGENSYYCTFSMSLCQGAKDHEPKKRLTVKDFNCKIYMDYERVEVFGEYAKRQTTRNSM